jgi:CRISPR-associated protein Cas1
MSRQLLNTLFVMTPGAYARLDGEAVRVDANGERLLQAPLLQLSSLVLFEGCSLSAPLLCRCAAEGREVTFLDFAGRFLARVVGPTSGNVLLRKAQYEAQADVARTLAIARPIVAGKIKNARQTLLRAAREVRSPEAAARLQEQTNALATYLGSLPEMETLDEVRGVEGQAAAGYFSVFGAMLTRGKAEFAFAARTRRPPRDRVNALLSFLYSLLTNDCVGAAEGAGLDPQFGFLHALRPGRPALALDLMEEFRSFFADRLALTLINRRQLEPDHFEERPGGSVLLTAEGRKVVLKAYQERKREEVTHPLLQAKLPLGLLPHVQARILARHLRGEMPVYLPYAVR